MAAGTLLLCIAERGSPATEERAHERSSTTAHDEGIVRLAGTPSDSRCGAIAVPMFPRVATDLSLNPHATPAAADGRGRLPQNPGGGERGPAEAEPKSALPAFDAPIWTAQFLQALDDASVEAPLKEWSKLHPGTCREFHGDDFVHALHESPCADCSVIAGPWKVTYSFFPDLDRGECTLQGIRIVSPVFPEKPLPPDGQASSGPGGERGDSMTLFVSLCDALIAEFGPPKLGAGHSGMDAAATPSPRQRRSLRLGLGECGSAYWTRYDHWNPHGGLAYLYLDQGGSVSSPQPRIGFLLRRAGLERLRSAGEGMSMVDVGLAPAPDWAALVRKACVESGGADCATAAALFGHHEFRDSAQIRGVLDATLASHLKLGAGDPRFPSSVFLLSLVAEEWVGTAGDPGNEAERQRVTALASVGIRVVAGYDGAQAHLGALAKLALEHQTSVWGHWALLKMTYRGWELCDCGAGTRGDRFRDVIAHVEPFLSAHADSPATRYLQFALAQAYETWWSLSKERKVGEVPDEWQRFLPGADAARKRAIEHYRTWLAAYGAELDDNQRLWLRHKLFRLERDIDTSEHRYYCECC